MYSRYSNKTPKYSPPPGYTGSTFSSDGEVKHHLPTDQMITEIISEEKDKPVEVCEDPAPQKCETAQKPNFGGLGELFECLKGKFSSEELIILAVMLLIAQDGIGVEVLILALILLTG